jgi:hypothetical protein
MFLKLIASLFGTLGAYTLYQVLTAVIRERRSPLRLLPGPRSTHWFYGNINEIMADVSGF